MKRRNFIYLTGVGAAAAMLPAIPVWGNEIPFEQSLEYIDPASKKIIADVALNAARSKGATYTDVRIGRYLNQYVVTREDKVQNLVNTESYGVGIRVIANGSWGFAATDKMDKDSIAKAAELAVAIARENSRLLTEPVKLAPQTTNKGFFYKIRYLSLPQIQYLTQTTIRAMHPFH